MTYPRLVLVCLLLLGGALTSGQQRDTSATWWRASGPRAATLPRAGLVSDADRRNRRAADRFACPHAGGALGARPLRGMGPRQPASRAVRVRPRMAARTHLGGDDRAALRSAHRVCRRMVAVNRGRRERTRRLRRRQDAAQIQAMAGQLRGAIVLTHLPQTQFVDRDRPQPGLDDRPVATGNPALPQARSTTPVNELDAAACSARAPPWR